MPDYKYTIDLTYLRTFCDGDEAFVQEMVETFLEKIPEELELLQAALHADNWEDAYKAIHSLKASFHFIGLEALQQMALELEEFTARRIQLDRARMLIPQMLATGWQAVQQLKELSA